MAVFSATISLSDLDGTNGFRIDGIDAYDFSGSSVSSAGDVNGDGFDDILIGAWGGDPNGDVSGESYVVFGEASGFGAALDLSSLNGSNGFVINGIDAFDWSGYSVSSAGDINGDGFDDILIGAWPADPSGSNSGESYLVFGKASGFGAALDLSSLNGTDGFVINGIDASDFSGRSVSSAGDVNGDGFDDILIGARGGDPSGNVSGESYVVFGNALGFGAALDLSSLNGTDGFVINGINAFDLSGWSVSSAGDVNGDGFDDVLIGAVGADPGGGYSGSSYVVFGAASGFGPDFDLSNLDGSNGFRIDGVAADDRSGNSVSSAGDVNGDGFDDILIGAYRADPNGSNSGSSYVVFGKASGFGADLALSSLDGMNGFRIDGVAAFDYSGRSVSSAGDVNGDGFDDILIGAWGADPGGSYSGSSYVVFGAASGFGASLKLSSLDGVNGFRIDGAAAGDNSGLSASSAGDVNGDGFDDILIGAPNADPNGNLGAGETYVLFGKGPGDFPAVLDLAALGTASGTTFKGVAADDLSGASVSSAGDVNGDGFDDILIGAYGADPGGSSSGASYVVFGAASGFATALDLSSLDGMNGFVINGIDAIDFSGRSVSSAGDVNGDGFDDLLVGADLADPNGSVSGESYVVFGKASGFAAALDLSSLDGTNGFVINGIDAVDYSGRSVSSAGDVNGDGFDDILIGAFGADPNGGNSGESYVVFGKASCFAAVLDLSNLDGINGFVINGIDADDNSGVSVSSAGDINGDGFDDVLIGAPYADPNGGASGESYVVFGKASGFATALDLSSLDGINGFVINGIDASDSSGFSVSSAGDVNGDGFDDVLIGAPYADPNGSQSGESYVVFGKASGFAAALDLSSLDGTNGFVINGIDTSDNSGFSVSSAGDVNGDGFDDVLIGARGADPNGSNSGASYVVFGAASGFAAALDLSNLDGVNGFRLDGIDASDFSGHSVSSAGDTNGDGFDDLLVGAYQADPDGVSNAGETYLIYGRAPTSAVTRIGAAGDQIIRGGAFDDTLNGLGGDDELFGAGGNDNVLGGTGDDILRGEAGDDTLNGQGNDDRIFGGAGIDSLLGGGGDDILNGGDGNDTLGGGSGNDTMNGDAGVDTLNGDGGNDTLNGGTSGDTLNGGDGNDTLNGDGGNDIINGGTGADILNGGDGNDTLDGEEGGDTLDGGSGHDTLRGGIQSDTILGGTGNDTIEGANGGDTIDGGAGKDNIIGQGGSDTIDGKGGADTISGGNANDTIRGGGGADIINANDGNDIVFGGGGADIINGGKAKDIIKGQGGDDTINGNSERDTLSGGGGNDIINGGSGNDILKGQTGDDILNGQQGDDTLTGNAGNDIFMFNGQGNDTITDMLSGNPLRDQIDVSSQGFANFNQVMATASQVGSNVVFNIGAGSLTVKNHVLSDFVANDFIL